jgi:hypothetical protein
MSDAADYERIRALTYEYTFRLDRGEFAAVAELLSAGQLRMAAKGMDDATIRGAGAIEDFYAGQVVTYDGDPRTRHLITNHAIEIGDDDCGARGECYFTVLQAVPHQTIETVVCGRYHDSFELVGGDWRFAEKVIEVDYLGPIGGHFSIDAKHAARP